MTWKAQHERLQREDCRPPAGYQAIEEIAGETGLSLDKARELVNRLIRAGQAEAKKAKKLTANGLAVPCTYYRLVEKAPQKKTEPRRK